jgi:hypothetical protein
MAFVRVNPNLGAEVTGHTLGSRAETHGPLERVLGDIAEDVANRSQAIARREFYRTGGYAAGIQAEHGLDEQGNLVGRVVATKYTSHWAEHGTSRMRAHHILTRAARQVGLEVTLGQVADAILGGGGGVARRAITSRRSRAIGGRQRAISGRR